jgi:hypothetical protein
MRTTLNLDDDVAHQLVELARKHGRSQSRIANELIRDGLRVRHSPPERRPYEPPVLHSGEPLLDVTDVQQALELIDDRG